MARHDQTGRPAPFLSLRWKAVTALSLVLILVNASLALLAYRQLAAQFDQQQRTVRERQARQLQALIDDRYQQMARLANVVPLLAPIRPDAGPEEHLREALITNGVMLDLEWDIRSIHWIPAADAQPVLLWPAQGMPLPAALVDDVRAHPEHTAKHLACVRDCRQFIAVPLLSRGRYGGALVLGRSVADALLAFHALTGAEAALLPLNPTLAQRDRFPAITHPEQTLTLFHSADAADTSDEGPANNGVPVTGVQQIEADDDWFEVFRLRGLAPDIDALVLNRITAQRQAIGAATRTSILIGLAGLVLSEGLLLLVMRTPLARLRRLAHMLPELAEQRFGELRRRLGTLKTALPLRDEIDLMVGTVGTVAERMEDMERDREEARNGLMWLAEHDPLTRLLNRRRFNAELARVVNDAVSRGAAGALMFVDLDQFKDVNDISGHHMGDRLLQRVSEQLETAAYGEGLLGRLGGDEFALILPCADSDHAIAMAARLQKSIQSVIVHSRSWRHQVSASIGIVLFPEHGTDAQQLMADADLAMYQAKEKGRGRWHLFSPEDQGRERANARVLWAERIAAALAENRYELHFQPIMELSSGRVWRAEALLRMRDPRGELVLPFAFIPIAEETGQIEAIDHWVLSHAIALMSQHRGLCLSVNLSANALQDPSLLPDIERLLSEHRVSPADLTFEVTETVAINSLRNATRLMRSIQEIGCRFALDDFGSGFASYAYLRQLPVDDVKIDGAFIRDIAYSREDQIFVRAVTEMAHGMGKRVIAEFVENEEIVQVLREIGVDFAQGYHIGRPAMPLGNDSQTRSAVQAEAGK